MGEERRDTLEDLKEEGPSEARRDQRGGPMEAETTQAILTAEQRRTGDHPMATATAGETPDLNTIEVERDRPHNPPQVMVKTDPPTETGPQEGGPLTMRVHQEGGPLAKRVHQEGGPLTESVHQEKGPLMMTDHQGSRCMATTGDTPPVEQKRGAVPGQRWSRSTPAPAQGQVQELLSLTLSGRE